MATKEVKEIQQKDNVAVLNAVRADASENYKSTVPVATEDNVKEVGRAIMEFQPNQNEFLNSLFGRIGKTNTMAMFFQSPLSFLKKGVLEFGEVVQNIWVDLLNSYDFKFTSDYIPTTGVEEFEDPDKREDMSKLVKTYYHSVNFQKTVKYTVSEEELNLCFTTANGLYDLVEKFSVSAMNRVNLDEYEMTLKTLTAGIAGQKTIEVEDPYANKENLNKLIIAEKEVAADFLTPSKQYNKAQVYNTCESPLLFISNKLKATMDVEALAVAFNMDKTEFMGRIISIPEERMPENTLMVLADERWFQIYTKLFTVKVRQQEAGLYYNVFTHYWDLFDTLDVMNCVVFKKSMAA